MFRQPSIGVMHADKAELQFPACTVAEVWLTLTVPLEGVNFLLDAGNIKEETEGQDNDIQYTLGVLSGQEKNRPTFRIAAVPRL